jgi:hypothetical protein
MTAELVPLFAFLTGALTALISSHQAVSKGIRVQQEILKCGAVAQGKVLRVLPPSLFSAFARVYFEFHPEGSSEAVRTSHVDRRCAAEKTSLPAVGASVGVRYLPDNPAQAVIAKLVSR